MGPTWEQDCIVSYKGHKIVSYMGFSVREERRRKRSSPMYLRGEMKSERNNQWREACQYEMDVLAKNGTWELLDLPTGRRAVKSKWVFKIEGGWPLPRSLGG